MTYFTSYTVSSIFSTGLAIQTDPQRTLRNLFYLKNCSNKLFTKTVLLYQK